MEMFNHKKYHFLGIGGIGVSAIARMLSLQGKEVSGSDNSQSEITDDLEKLGIKIFIGQKAENLETGTEVVIFTVAMAEDNPELKEARKRGLICLSYPEVLGEISKKMFTIAVAGTHGKTTTTAMIGHILKKADLDPTIIVGSKMLGGGKREDSNFHAGKGRYLVVEACEYKRSFLNIHPKILVITNIETDHLDYYRDLSDIQSAFKEMIQKVPTDGFIITKPKEKNIKEILSGVEAKILDYSSVKIDKEIGVPGKHNILNAEAAVKATISIGMNEEIALGYLSGLQGYLEKA